MKNIDNELTLLEKKLRTSEAIFNKEKALLEQKVELLKIELSEVKEEKANQARMYETMLSALRTEDQKSFISSIIQHLNIEKGSHIQDIKDMMKQFTGNSENHNEIIQKLKSEHQQEIDKLTFTHSKELEEVRSKLLRDKRDLLNRIKTLECSKAMPEI